MPVEPEPETVQTSPSNCELTFRLICKMNTFLIRISAVNPSEPGPSALQRVPFEPDPPQRSVAPDDNAFASLEVVDKHVADAVSVFLLFCINGNSIYRS